MFQFNSTFVWGMTPSSLLQRFKRSQAGCRHLSSQHCLTHFPIQCTVPAIAYQLSALTPSQPLFLLFPLIFSFVFPLIIISILKMTTKSSTEAQSRIDGVRSQKLLILYLPLGAAMAQSV